MYIHPILLLSFFRHIEPTNTKPFHSMGRVKFIKNLRINSPFIWHRGIGRALNRPVKQSVIRRVISALAEISKTGLSLGIASRGMCVNLDCKSPERSRIVHMLFLLGKMPLVLCDFKSVFLCANQTCLFYVHVRSLY